MKKMIQEEKQLLIKDLCARLPYGVYCQIKYKRRNKVLEECKQLDGAYFNSIECLFRSESGAEYSTDYKPYLRPMSSMTEEEKKELSNYDNSVQRTDFFYSHHIDCRFMIEKGLALIAPEDMYKIE